MDIDQEVVREPFEDESLQAASPINTSHTDIDSVLDNVSEHYHQEDEESSTASNEDIQFAQSFGISLRNSKNKQVSSACKRLFTDKPSKSDKSDRILKTSVTSDCIYHRGVFYQKGDIVALYDQNDGKVYFAQLTGFLQDLYCEKSASLNWLVPIRPTSRESFDPTAYKIGLEDANLRKLDCMTFVRHCPHDYYFRKFFNAPSAEPDRQSLRSKKGQAFIWTTMKPCPVPKL